MKIRNSKIWIDTGGRPSESAKVLGAQEGFKRNKTGNFIKYPDIFVNWGSTADIVFPRYKPKTVLNHPVHVRKAANKLTSFNIFVEAEVPIPKYTTHPGVASGWNTTFFARTKLTGHSGDGIIVVEKGTRMEDIPAAPLYVQYIFKIKEYRSHVVNGKVIDTQQKIRDPDREPVTWKIRSHANGFIFARDNVVPDVLRDNVAIRACAALGLNFGAVDIIQHSDGTYLVLEVNTAPGLEGQTVHSYADAFRAY